MPKHSVEYENIASAIINKLEQGARTRYYPRERFDYLAHALWRFSKAESSIHLLQVVYLLNKADASHIASMVKDYIKTNSQMKQ